MVTQNKKKLSSNAESGSAILWILVAVSLFAALNYAFSSGSRNSTSSLDDAEATAYANQIIQYGNEVKSAVKRLTLRGCSDTEISFENNVVAGYTNPNSPTDKSCHVFDIAGGGLSYIKANEVYLDNSYSALSNYSLHTPSGDVRIPDVGTSINGPTGNELYLSTTAVKLEICQKINKIFNVSDSNGTPPSSGHYAGKFDGDYNHAAEFILNAEVTGKNKFCIDHISSGKFVVIQTLIAR